MSFQTYLEKLDGDAGKSLDLIPSGLCEPIEPFEHSAIALQKTSAVIQQELNEHFGLSSLAMSCMEKIAEEVTSITLQSRLGPIEDRQYKYLMKEAGVTVPDGRNDYMNSLFTSAMQKISSGVSLTHEESLLEKFAFFRRAANWVARGGAARQGRSLLKAEQALPGQLATQSSKAMLDLERKAYKAISDSGNPALLKQLASLPKDQQRVFALRQAKSLIPKEVAKVKNISKQRTESLVARGDRAPGIEFAAPEILPKGSTIAKGAPKPAVGGTGAVTPKPPEGGSYKGLATGLGVGLPVAGIGAYLYGSSGSKQRNPYQQQQYPGYGYR